MQTVTILCVGKLKDPFYADASAEYCKRLGAFCRVTVREIPAASLLEDPADALIERALRQEGEKLLKAIPAGDTVVALCVEGKLYDSPEVAGLLTRAASRGSGVTFIIGGSYGLHDDVKKRADARLSMSRMTFPHRLARVMLLEQIYRGYMIASGRQYHK